jgi:hypothetical protein
VGLRYRRLGLIAATFLLVLGAPATVAAADPSAAPSPSDEVIVDVPNLVFEARLTVRYVEPGSLLPVAGAEVLVVARQGGEVLGEYSGSTGEDGMATVDALPFEAGFGPIVELDVIAHKDASWSDPETGCRGGDGWDAKRLGVMVESPVVEVDFAANEQTMTSSINCPEATPTGAVGGVIGTPGITPPPTDGAASSGSASTSRGGLVVVGLVLGLAGLLLLAVRPLLARR